MTCDVLFSRYGTSLDPASAIFGAMALVLVAFALFMARMIILDTIDERARAVVESALKAEKEWERIAAALGRPPKKKEGV